MSSYWLSTEQFSVSLQGMSMGDKEQLREIERGRNIENGTLLISQLKYECADIIDKLFVLDNMELIFTDFVFGAYMTEEI